MEHKEDVKQNLNDHRRRTEVKNVEQIERFEERRMKQTENETDCNNKEERQ